MASFVSSFTPKSVLSLAPVHPTKVPHFESGMLRDTAQKYFSSFNFCDISSCDVAFTEHLEKES